jgi:hypothetical protein
MRKNQTQEERLRDMQDEAIRNSVCSVDSIGTVVDLE